MLKIKKSDLRSQLYTASTKLTQLKLFHAAKWSSEALQGLAPVNEPFEPPLPELSDDEKHDQFAFMLASSYFDCKEFDRAAHALRNCVSGDALFLRLYSQFLSIDKRSLEEADGSLNMMSVRNHLDISGVSSGESGGKQKELVDLLNTRVGKIVSDADAYHEKGGKPNAFLFFLVGLISSRNKNVSLAQASFRESLKLFPWNWSCWQELISTFSSFEDATLFISQCQKDDPELADHLVFQCFELVILQEFYQQLASFNEKIAFLTDIFPTFNFLKVQSFLVAYHELDYFEAEQIFDDILKDDPMRLDDLDTYSNMLYVMEKKSKLSFLAQYSSQIDKFRSETCCIVANYHSMKGEHDKSIMYYKRALALNKNCLSAWTLMGHEFVELKNSHAAIESYRRAVDINPKDFRAWYGLGQAYEVLDMHLYALYYYQRATNLQPMDKRMWQAIGNCYEKIERLHDAVRSFEKALAIDMMNKAGDDGADSYSLVEPHICFKLAVLLEKLNRPKDTYRFMRTCYEQEMEWGVTDETSKARLWLARHALEACQFEEAYDLAREFNLSNAHDIEEARAIAKEARSRMTR